ncbi:MAG: Na/Pi cotransporter family protein, partial [Bdellovibrio sp.]
MTIAGISFFMYGMTLASENLQKLAANKIRGLISKLSDRPIVGVFVGILLTILIQSSGAVTSMLVGLGTAGVVTLQQVMGVILGTAIGTTITVQILSLNVAQYGLPLFTFAFVFYFLSKKRPFRRAMAVVMGFGLIFYGLELIGQGTQAIRETNYFINSLEYFKENPVVAIIVTAIFTAIVHSSAVTVGFAMSLAASGLISLTDAIYWVYGANIGTTATALVASLGGNYIARQIAWAHCFYKTASVFLFYFFTSQFAQWIQSSHIQRDVANSHTIFNIIAALIFLP